jgi:hypothetical protein
MVRAILDGRKTQTRRVIKPQSAALHGKEISIEEFLNTSGFGNIGVFAPHQPGDTLWVRETWMPNATIDSLLTGESLYTYKADWTDIDLEKLKTGVMGKDAKWRPSIHMPREAARIFLRVTNVRGERVQHITPLDACCEGILVELPDSMRREQAGLPPIFPDEWQKFDERRLDVAIRNQAVSEFMKRQLVMRKLVRGYQELWNSLNAKRGFGWKSNPWVWVYEFERV